MRSVSPRIRHRDESVRRETVVRVVVAAIAIAVAVVITIVPRSSIEDDLIGPIDRRETTANSDEDGRGAGDPSVAQLPAQGGRRPHRLPG